MSLKKIIVLLLGLNFFAQLIWLFGFHNERLILLSATGLSLLVLFFFVEKSIKALQFKVILIFSVLFGIINLESGFLIRSIIDLCAFGIIASVFLIQRIELKQIKRLFYFIIALSLIYFAYSIPLMDLTLIFADIDRREAFTQYGREDLEGGGRIGYVIYSTQQYVTGVFYLALLLLPLYYDKKKAKIYWLILGLILLFSMIFIGTYQKRQQLLEILMVLFIFIIYYRKLLPGLITKHKMFSILLFLSLIVVGVSMDIFNSTVNRLTQDIEKIDSFDRKTELEFALNKFSIIDFMFGMGVGSKIEGTTGGNNLHIGYGTLLMKGGMILLVFYFLTTLSNIVYCYKRAKLYPIFYVGVAISFFSMIQLSYSPGWSWFLTSLITGLAMFSRYPLNKIVYDKYSSLPTK